MLPPEIVCNLKEQVLFNRPKEILLTDRFINERVTACNDKYLVVSDEEEVVCRTMRTGEPVGCNLVPKETKGVVGHVTALEFHPDGQTLFVGYEISCLRSWDIWQRKQPLRNYKGHTGAIRGISATSNNVATICDDNTVRIYGWNTLAPDWEKSSTMKFTVVKLSDNNKLYVATFSGQITVLDWLKDQQMLKLQDAHYGEITDLYVYHPAIISCGADGTIKVWSTKIDPEEQIPIVTMTCKRIRINSIGVCESCVVSGHEDGNVYIWEWRSKTLKRRMKVNMDCNPVTKIHILNYENHCKIIASSNACIKVFEFPKSIKGKNLVELASRDPVVRRSEKKVVPRTKRQIEDNKTVVWREMVDVGGVPYPMTASGRRLWQLWLRFASEPRDKAGVEYEENILSRVFGEQHKVIIFPRRYKQTESDESKSKIFWPSDNGSKEDIQKKNEDEQKNISYKGFLPISNPYKFY